MSYTAIAASEWFEKIYLSDLLPANVDFLRKWMHGESEHMEYLMKEYALKDGTGYVCMYYQTNEAVIFARIVHFIHSLCI